MVNLYEIIIFIIGGIFLLFWLFLYAKGYKHHEMFEGLNESEYPLSQVYFVGYELLEMIGYEYKSKKDREDRRKISIYYGSKYVEYYLRVQYAQRITLLLTLLVFSFVMYGFVGDVIILIVMIILSLTIYYHYSTLMKSRVEKRSEELIREFPNVVSKLALLTNAGMIMKEAWYEVSNNGDSKIYQEMRYTVDEIENGTSEIEAYINFGTRSFLPEIKKFASTIAQGVLKGNAELSIMLQQQSKEVWGIKKQDVMRQGEKAASKLTIPLMLMFIGILVMIIIPIFASVGGA
ncbi:type II secretion system F family protein [Helcococcus kunzii]|uniref:type II secretion system F family protein n=1 Tax=Helcococcus kunzii TaxID=40091 RepID=UPI0024AC9033|nr:type II secretion system F family protein [Helcococcus kunzii]